MSHLFNNNVEQSVINNIKSSIRIEDGAVRFTVNTGKGSGEQGVSASDFSSVVECLQGYVDSGIFAGSEDASPVDTIKRTIAHDPETGTISFRLTNGKGAKPVKVSVTDFPKVVAFLRDCSKAVEATLR